MSISHSTSAMPRLHPYEPVDRKPFRRHVSRQVNVCSGQAGMLAKWVSLRPQLCWPPAAERAAILLDDHVPMTCERLKGHNLHFRTMHKGMHTFLKAGLRGKFEKEKDAFATSTLAFVGQSGLCSPFCYCRAGGRAPDRGRTSSLEIGFAIRSYQFLHG